jgi:hypothetical protein
MLFQRSVIVYGGSKCEHINFVDNEDDDILLMLMMLMTIDQNRIHGNRVD